MATHKVNLQLPTVSLGKTDVVFNINTNGFKAGELRVSHGAVVWFPASAKMGYRISWERLTRWMEENGKKCEYSN